MIDPSEVRHSYEYAACGLATFDEDGTLLHVNQTLLMWTGLPQSEIPKTRIQDMLGPGSKLYFTLFVLPAIQLHDQVNEISIELKSVKGNFPALLSAVASRPNKGSDLIIEAAIYKITDRKKFEKELLKEKDQAKQQNIRQAIVLEEIAFNQAHLIRAPLANIIGLTGMLQQDAETSADTRQIIALLKTSTDKLDDIIKKIVGSIG